MAVFAVSKVVLELHDVKDGKVDKAAEVGSRTAQTVSAPPSKTRAVWA